MSKPNIQLRDIDAVTPYALNAKIHDPKQVEKIAKSITEFGWDQPIVVDKDGVIIKGHGRRLAAISLNMKQVPVWVRDDLTEDQVRASRLADNRVAISNIDSDILQQELAGISFDLDGIFDKKELEFLLADMGELNVNAFVADLDEAIATQAIETEASLVEVDNKEVRIDKALGFKSIKGRDERHVVMFIAQLEEETGLPAAEAFVEFIKTMAGVGKTVVPV